MRAARASSSMCRAANGEPHEWQYGSVQKQKKRNAWPVFERKRIAPLGHVNVVVCGRDYRALKRGIGNLKSGVQ
jgi:hypothetical protein